MKEDHQVRINQIEQRHANEVNNIENLYKISECNLVQKHKDSVSLLEQDYLIQLRDKESEYDSVIKNKDDYYSNQISNLKSALSSNNSDYVAHNESLSLQNIELNNKITNLINKNNELVNQLNIEKQSIISQYSNEVEQLNNKNRFLTDEVAIANDNYNKYRDEVSVLKSNVNMQKNQEIEYLSQIKKLNNDNTLLVNSSQSESIKRVKEYESALQQLTNDFSIKNKENELKYDEKLIELKNQFSIDLEESKKEVHRLKANDYQNQKLIDNYRDESQRLKDTIHKFENSHSEFIEREKSLEIDINNLRQTLITLEKEKIFSDEQHQNSKKSIQEANNKDIDVLKNDLKLSQKLISEYEIAQISMRDKISETDRLVIELNHKLGESENRIELLQADLKNYHITNENNYKLLKEKLEEKYKSIIDDTNNESQVLKSNLKQLENELSNKENIIKYIEEDKVRIENNFKALLFEKESTHDSNIKKLLDSQYNEVQNKYTGIY